MGKQNDFGLKGSPEVHGVSALQTPASLVHSSKQNSPALPASTQSPVHVDTFSALDATELPVATHEFFGALLHALERSRRAATRNRTSCVL